MQEQHHPDLGTTKSGMQPNVAGLIAYLPFWIGLVASIYFLATEKENHFVRFHSLQSIFLSLAGLVLWLPFFIIGLLPVAMILSLALLVAWIWCLYQAYQGVEYKLPLLGDLAAQHA